MKLFQGFLFTHLVICYNVTKKCGKNNNKFVTVFLSKTLAFFAIFVYNGIVVTNVYWLKIQYKSIDDVGGCKPLSLVFPRRMSDSRNRAAVTLQLNRIGF